MTHRKNILLISYHTCPLASEEGKETGGMNVYVYELAHYLARLGNHVDVITRCTDPKNETIVQVSDNFRVIHLCAGPKKPVHKKKLLAYIPEFIESFSSFTQKHMITYDVMHAHYYQSGLIGLSLKSKLPKPIPLVVTFHTLVLMKHLVARSAAELDTQERIDAEFRLISEADIITTPSSSDRQYLKYLYGANESKMVEVPPGVNTELFYPVDKNIAKEKIGVNPQEKIIVFVGRIEPLKGIDAILYALKILQQKAPDLQIRLLIIGGDITQHIKQWSPQLKQLESLRRILKISELVDFVGQQPQNRLRDYYNAAEIVVMPSHYESFGMAAAEAMACGVPVITTNVTGISDLIDDRHSTLISTVNNPLLLAEQMEKLLTNPSLYEQIRTSLTTNIQELRWEVVAKKVDTIYTNLVNANNK